MNPALPQAIAKDYKASFFADTGPYARGLFLKSMEVIRSTALYKTTNIFGSNRSSKSITIAYIFSNWATGDYPEWWDGWVLRKPGRFWLAGETSALVQNNIQRYLIGTKQAEGENCFIGKHLIEDVDYYQDFAKRIVVKSAFGGSSIIELKTYDMRRARFASDTLDAVGLDEEPGPGIYSEAITRTATTQGKVVCGFTALKGITPLVVQLAPEFAGEEADDPEETSKNNVVIAWEDIPFSVLSRQERKILAASYQPHELLARTKGIPSVGSGLVYPISESEFVIPDFQIPDHWPRLFSMDPGFKDPTAISQWAYDADSDAVYQYAEYYVRGAPVPVHADWIHRAGDWVPVVFDYAGGNITDGKAVGSSYRKALRNPVFNANKSLDLGHREVWDRLQTGRMFVFESLRNSRQEFRQYHRKEDRRVADTPHHLLDTWRYAVTGIQHAKQKPIGYTFNGENMRPPTGPITEVSLTQLWS